MKQKSYLNPRPVIKDHPRCLGTTIKSSPKPDQLRSTLNDLLDGGTLRNRAPRITGICEEHRGWDVSFDEGVQDPVRDHVADVDTTLHPDAALKPLGHANDRGIVALNLERDATRDDGAQAAANSQRSEVHGALEAFLVETDTSPRSKRTPNSATRGAPLLQRRWG